MKVIKYGCNHGNRNNLNEILHGILKQAIIKHNNIHHKYFHLKIMVNHHIQYHSDLRDYISDTTCRFCRKHAWRLT